VTDALSPATPMGYWCARFTRELRGQGVRGPVSQWFAQRWREIEAAEGEPAAIAWAQGPAVTEFPR